MLAELARRYGGRGIILDANILLLFVVGSIDPKQVSSFRRTRIFVEEDYHTLLDVLAGFNNKIVTTPHVLTEVSNLLRRLA